MAQPQRRSDDPENTDHSGSRAFARFDKTFNVPTVVAVIASLGAMYAALSSRDVEISLLKQGQTELRTMHAAQIESQRRTDEQQSREFRDWYSLVRSDIGEVKTQFGEVRQQLQRIIENSNTRK